MLTEQKNISGRLQWTTGWDWSVWHWPPCVRLSPVPPAAASGADAGIGDADRISVPRVQGGSWRFLRELLQSIANDQVSWRRGFHPEDPPSISAGTLAAPEAAATRNTLKQQLANLSNRLQTNSNPWFSPRYLGHLNSDLLLPAVAGYFSAMLYNANTVVYEGG